MTEKELMEIIREFMEKQPCPHHPYNLSTDDLESSNWLSHWSEDDEECNVLSHWSE